MESSTLLDLMDRVLDSSRRAVLATVDSDGVPSCRWMVTGILRGAPGFLYSVTAPQFHKTAEIEANPNVAWLLQTDDLSEVVHVTGEAKIVDNPALKSDVLEAIGHDLATFWQVNPAHSELVVIETVIKKIDYFQPNKGEHARASVEV